MDDFVISSLEESKNEWCIRLYNALAPHIIDGIYSLFNEAFNMCMDSKEPQKYLMTFQNILSRVPKWNAVTIEEEKKRILAKSGCSYMEDLITCVQIIQLKCLTCIRVGNKQKKIDLETLKLDVFIHKVYILVARKIYTKIFLFETVISSLEKQKNREKIEFYVRESIMNVIRDSIPTEQIIMAYLDETTEEEVTIETETMNVDDLIFDQEKEKDEEKEKTQYKKDDEPIVSIQDLNDEPVVTRLKFNNFDSILNMENNEESLVNAPKTLKRLEEISSSRALQKKMQTLQEDEDNRDEMSSIQILEPIDIDLQPMELDDVVDL
jgi:hypothetical protein